MRNLTLTLTALFLVFGVVSYAQMEVQGQIRYGNEWIDYNKEYLKLKVAEDGIYRLSYNEFITAGIDPNEIVGKDVKMYHNGEEVALHTTNIDTWGTTDYLEFYGEKNKIELDKFLFEDWENEMLNTAYSMFNDTSAYFLTFDTSAPNLRYTEKSNNLSGSLPNPTDHYLHTEQKVFSSDHNKPLIQGLEVKYSSFVEAEGYGSDRLSNHTISLDTPNKVDGDGEAYAYVRLGSNNPTFAHRLTGTVNNSSLGFQTWSGSKVRVFEGEIALNDIEDKTEIKLTSDAGSNSKTQVSVARITYPRSFDFSGASSWAFDLPQSNFSRYIEIINFNNSIAPVLYDHVNHEFHIGNTDTGVLRYLIGPKQNKPSFILIGSDDDYKSPADISSKTFIDFSNVNPNFMMLTSKAMDKTINGQNVVQEYAEYRRSDIGGNYDVEIVHQDEIYDQFAYGVDRHNIANRNFAHYIENVWTNLDYWYVVGKGQEYNLVRTNEDNLSNAAVNHVSPFGQPGSDMLNVCSRGTADPKFLIGRIAAKDQDELADYFEKVKQHDDLSYWDQTIEGKAWMKKVIHLSGGDPDIQQGIFNFLERMRDTLENNRFGADVFTFRKFSSDAIETSQSEEIRGIIDEGSSIVTFFGHSAVGTFDFSLEDVSQYNNYRKYPLILSLGCLSGNVHGTERGLSEDFVLEPEKGAIAFLAASGTAYVSTQGRSGTDFYSDIGGNFYGSNLGILINEIYQSNKNSSTAATRSLMQQLTLHGDPAVKLNPHEGVDYTLDKQKVTINPTVISTNIPNFTLNFDVNNIGFHRAQELEVLVQHRGPKGDVLFEELLTVDSPPNHSTLSISIPTPDVSQLGNNSIEIIVDPNDKIEELPAAYAETNNKLTELTNGEGFCFYVLDNGVNTVYPYDFAIVNDECPFELKASTNNAFIEEQSYIFEIDTTALFNSPALERGTISQRGGLVSYSPTIDKVDDRVYYWRVSPDSIDANVGYLWKEASFTYDSDGEEGWNQSHYYQFLKNDLQSVRVSDDRKWEFLRQQIDMRFDLGISNIPGEWIFVNGSSFGSLNPQSIGSFVGVTIRHPELDIVSREDIGDFGSIAPHRFLWAYHLDTPESRKNLMDLLNSIPEQGEVFIYTVVRSENANFYIDEWESDKDIYGTNLFEILEEYGSSEVNILKDRGTVPFLFNFEKDKGDIVWLNEQIAETITDEIEYSLTAERFFTNGEFESTIIGNSNNWDKILWDYSDLESQDSLNISIFVMLENGTEEELINLNAVNEIDLSDLNEISANTIKIKIRAADPTNRTIPQINNIKVLYRSIPDIAISTENINTISFDTIQQGEPLLLKVPLVNYTNKNFDSSELIFGLTSLNNSSINQTLSVPKIDPKSTVEIEINQDSKNLSGAYTWTILHNESENPNEQHYTNNFAIGSVYVEKDDQNPILNVTFDGQVINNGDLISYTPIIEIESKDENSYLLIDEREYFDLAITDPLGNTEPIDLQSSDIEFQPSETSEDAAKIIYTPTFSIDGEYSLIAQTRDASGNFSGDQAYEINFEVNTKKSVSNVFNYPNPFSTSTQFVFTITGDTPPEGMYINIYTLSGKLVKQISEDELGPIRIGHNRTDYRWTGTDEYGDKLANGVYLYKVNWGNNSLDDFEQYFTNADLMFKNGFGKMVIMR